MPQGEQLGTIAIEFVGQLRGGDALGESSEDQDQFAGPAADAVKDGFGEGIKDATAMAATVIESGSTVTAMGQDLIGAMAARAGEATGVQPGDQGGITSVLIHQVGDGKVMVESHMGDDPGRTWSILKTGLRRKSIRHHLTNLSRKLLLRFRISSQFNDSLH